MLTHAPEGEYTRHRRHEETARAVVALCRGGRSTPGPLAVRLRGRRRRLPAPGRRGRRSAGHLPEALWARKAALMTGVYGFTPDQLGSPRRPPGEPSAAPQNEGGPPMKILVLYDYPPAPGGLATQGDLLYQGCWRSGVDAKAAHLKSDLEKEWYYRWFKPDAVVGVGFWGDYPDIVQHPQRFGMPAVPWLLADGYVANYRQVLNVLPLILVTANWVKETFVRDGIRGDHMRGPAGGRAIPTPSSPGPATIPRCPPCGRSWA